MFVSYAAGKSSFHMITHLLPYHQANRPVAGYIASGGVE